MSDILIILGGGVIGFLSAMMLRLFYMLFLPINDLLSIGRTGQSGALQLAACVAFICGLLGCLALLGAHWGGEALTPHYEWQYTPPLMALSWLVVFLTCAVLGGRKTRK